MVIFFVVFMGSLVVYLGKWGVSQTPLTDSVDRSPEFLFVYTPTSFGWRELMLKDSPIELTTDPTQARPDKNGYIVSPVEGYWYKDTERADQYMKPGNFSWYNHAGAGMVAFWVTILFMLMLGFSYSYFWTAASMIYLLMRRKVDETEVDEIYLEEEMDEPMDKVSPPSSTPLPPSGTTVAVDPPSLRHPAVPPTSPAPPPPPPAPTPLPEPSTAVAPLPSPPPGLPAPPES